MNKVLYIILISLFSLTVFSCSEKEESSTTPPTTSSPLFVSVGNSGTILTSSDGTTWTSKTSGTNEHLYGVTYANSTFVVVGDNDTGTGTGTILTSPDGTTWTSRTSGTSNELYKVIYGNSTFVIVGGSGTILTSSDGITWTSRTSGTTEHLFNVTYGNSTFVADGVMEPSSPLLMEPLGITGLLEQQSISLESSTETVHS